MFARARSFGTKLMLLVALSTTVAVLLVAATYTILERLALEPRALSHLVSQADVIAIHSTAALSFDDRDAGAETLAALLEVEEVVAAQLFDASGRLFATYRRPGIELDLPATPDEPGHRFDARTLWLTREVTLGERRLGSLRVVQNLERSYTQTNRQLATGALVGTVAAMLALGLAFQLQRRLVQPVVELIRVANTVSRTGDYGVRARRLGVDELAILTDTFNQMLDEIQRYQAEQAQAEQMLRRNAAELERSMRELDEFAYVASHDLKSPLQGIRTLASWIEEDNADSLSDKSRRHLRQMQQRVTRLDALLDDLLQYSRAGRVDRDIVDVDTTELVHDAAALLGPPDGVTVSVADGAPRFRTARVPLEQVFRNLINNAIKHHDRGAARIEVGYADCGERFEFSVADDGPGIEPQFHEKVFQMFETLTPRDRVEGSGMGLAVIKKIVETFGGTIRVRSAPGRGATFLFTWPKTIGAENP